MTQSGARAAAVLFDMDGVLVDTEPVWYDVETELVERLGGRWGRAHQARCVGGTLRSTASYIAEHTGTARPVEQLMTDLVDGMHERLRTSVPTIPGALELVDAVRHAGVPTALVTSTYRALVDAVLQAVGHHRFDVVVTGDEVNLGKPDPAPYLLACERLAVQAEACVVIEDSLNGVRSGLAAGCVVVAVPAGETFPESAKLVIRNELRDVDASWLLTLPDRKAA